MDSPNPERFDDGNNQISELNRLIAENAQLKQLLFIARQERDAALARIAELEKQEPVAQFNWNAAKFEWLTKYDYHKHHLKPLYLAAGASPQPSQALSPTRIVELTNNRSRYYQHTDTYSMTTIQLVDFVIALIKEATHAP